jgi:predicted GIY-YIG superfamily endonuclease
MGQRRFGYILRSAADPDRHYVGITSDVERRIHWQARGASSGT